MALASGNVITKATHANDKLTCSIDSSKSSMASLRPQNTRTIAALVRRRRTVSQRTKSCAATPKEATASARESRKPGCLTAGRANKQSSEYVSGLLPCLSVTGAHSWSRPSACAACNSTAIDQARRLAQRNVYGGSHAPRGAETRVPCLT
eukprot:2412108-Pleurochrysis_carterae.AAC.2